jgi:CTP:molybdopterin cytidylyltransferase MocA
MTTAGLVLAAGPGTRFGGPKAPVLVDGERLVDHAVRVLAAGGCDPVIVVLGAWVGRVAGANLIVNDNWPEGMGSSLREGLVAIRDTTEADAALITLVDLPGLTSEAVRRVIEHDPDAEIVQATYRGERGHPVRLARSTWADAIEAARGDEGARRLIRSRSDVALVEVGDVADGQDMDVPDS